MRLATTAVDDWNSVTVASKSRSQLTRQNRIIKALGSGSHIPRVEDKLLSRYYTYLTEHLCFPFIAHSPKPMNSQEEEDFRCAVLELLDPANDSYDEFDGIFCKTSKEKFEINLPLIDLYLPEDTFGFQLIDDYWFWFWNWR